MGLTLVQAIEQDDFSGTTDASISKAFASNVTAGNLLLCFFAGDRASSPTSGVTDSLGQTWTQIGTPTHFGGAYGQWFYKKATAGGACTVTATLGSGGETFVFFVIMEVSGADATAPIDTSDLLKTGTSTSGNPTSNSITTGAPNCMAISVCTSDAGSWTFTPPGGWTALGTLTAAAYKIVAASGSAVSAAWTKSGSGSIAYWVPIVSIKPASTPTETGSAALTGHGTLAGTGRRRRRGSAALTGQGSLMAAGAVPTSIPAGHMPLCSAKVEVAWGQDTTGLFTFGTSRFGSATDLMAASSWSQTFAGVYDDISADVIDWSVSRGRDSDVDQMRAGTLTVNLRDPAGIYNRYNPASPLAGLLVADLPIRLTLYDALGIAYGRFYGFTQQVEADVAGRGTAQIVAVDFLDRLSREKPNLGTIAPGATDGMIFGALLDELAWTDPAMRRLAVGDTIGLAYTRADGSRFALDLISELLAAERGVVFVDRSGAVAYLDRHSRLVTASLGTIDRTLTAFQVGVDGQGVVNQWTVTCTDMDGNLVGAPQFWQDDASVRHHGPTPDQLETPFLSGDVAALVLAQGLVLRGKDGLLPVYQVPINVVDYATQVQCFARDLGDRVTLNVDPLNFAPFTGDFIIESIDESGTTTGSPRYTCSWRVSSVPDPTAFRFGPSRMGGADVMYW